MMSTCIITRIDSCRDNVYPMYIFIDSQTHHLHTSTVTRAYMFWGQTYRDVEQTSTSTLPCGRRQVGPDQVALRQLYESATEHPRCLCGCARLRKPSSRVHSPVCPNEEPEGIESILCQTCNYRGHLRSDILRRSHKQAAFIFESCGLGSTSWIQILV